MDLAVEVIVLDVDLDVEVGLDVVVAVVVDGVGVRVLVKVDVVASSADVLRVSARPPAQTSPTPHPAATADRLPPCAAAPTAAAANFAPLPWRET